MNGPAVSEGQTVGQAVEQCPEYEGALLCHLPAGHEGLHYDDIDKISWKLGEPDE